jgi:D-alanyl-D-alanine endopeptidase (penicillin-binding protein 7)
MKILFLTMLLLANSAFAKLAPTSVYLYNLSTGQTIVAENTYEVKPIASITKLMTAMVAIDYSKDLDKQLIVSKKLKSHLPMKEHTRGEVLTALLVGSDNAAAETIAEDYPNGREGFMRAMNQKARDLNMKNTKFLDPSGLSVFNVSVAEEVAIMVNEASKYELIRQLTTTKETTFDVPYKKKVKTTTLVNTNRPVLVEFASIIASKTGLTNAAGWCLAMSVENNDQKYLLVVLGSKSKQARLQTVEQLMYNYVIDKGTK